jgi:hypothetical protein
MHRLALVALVACHRPVPAPTPVRAAVVAADAAAPDAEPDAPPDAPDDAPDDANLADEFPVDKQAIGPLRIGMTDKQAIAVLGAPQQRSVAVLMGALGDYESVWAFGSVTLQMSGAQAKGPFRVASISVSGRSAFKTPAGIGIGSTRDEIVAVYGKYLGASNDPAQVLVGSVYYGLLFTLDGDRVVAIFLGAMAF